MTQNVAPRRAPTPQHPLADAEFDWQDPLALAGELGEDERMVQETARGYAQDRLFPRVLTITQPIRDGV